MKKLLIAALTVSICVPVMAAPPATSQQKKNAQHATQRPGQVKPLEQYHHKAGFYQSTETRAIAKDAVVETGTKVGAGAVETGSAASAGAAASSGGVAATVPAAGTGLGLSTPLVGSLTVGAAVGIGAAVVAAGVAIGNHGGGGHHGSGTTGTTK